MFDYLKKVGFKLDSFKIVVKPNYRFPTLSCKLNDEEDGLVFSLNYFISDDFSKQSLDFTFEDWYNWKRRSDIGCSDSTSSVSTFDVIERNVGFRFFQYFSITETLLTNVYQSRLKGRKAWKKRNWYLSIRWANVYKAFGIEHKKSIDKNVTTDLVKVVDEIVELDKLMNLCVHKACQDFSYMPFDLYYDCYKKKLALQKKIEKTDGSRTNRDKVFKEFAKQVVELQKNAN